MFFRQKAWTISLYSVFHATLGTTIEITFPNIVVTMLSKHYFVTLLLTLLTYMNTTFFLLSWYTWWRALCLSLGIIFITNICYGIKTPFLTDLVISRVQEIRIQYSYYSWSKLALPGSHKRDTFYLCVCWNVMCILLLNKKWCFVCSFPVWCVRQMTAAYLSSINRQRHVNQLRSKGLNCLKNAQVELYARESRMLYHFAILKYGKRDTC